MHIAYFAPKWPATSASNGIVTHVHRMREILIGMGHHVSVLSQGIWHSADGSNRQLASDPPSLADRLKWRTGWPQGHLPQAGRTIASQFGQIHAAHAIDVLQMEESFGWVRRVQSELKIPTVTRLHGPHSMSAHRSRTKESEQRISAEARAIRTARAITAPSAMTLAEANRLHPFSTDLVKAIPNPIRIAEPPMRWSRERCDPWQLLWVGRFDHAKGADIMLEAFAMIATRFPDMKLVMIGPDIGLPADDGRLLQYEAYVDAHIAPSVRARVTFLGAQTPEAIEAARRESFLGLVTSRSETFGNVAQEGTAMGLPMIGTDCGGIAEVILDGETGRLVRNKDAGAVAEAVSWMVEHREQAVAMSANALARCDRLFSPNAIGAETLAFFDNAIRAFPKH